jgi:Tfp pilus assembly protein PilF
LTRSSKVSLAGWLSTGVAAAALAGASSPAAAAPDSAVKALVRQGVFWRARGRPELAAQSLQKALTADPDNIDALAALAAYAAEDGDAEAARRWTQRLRSVAPHDPRLERLTRAAEAPAVAAVVSRARKAVAAGDPARAIALYRHAFDGASPPPAYAQEYYHTLAGTAGGWEEGRRGLKRLADASPADPALQLAYAQVLTYRPAARREGIAALSRLGSGTGAPAESARQAWRQALLWLGGSAKDAQLYQAYLARSPQDEAVRAELGKATAAPAGASAGQTADRGAAARAEGFAALNRGEEALAEAGFARALKLDSRDRAALGGLGLVRLRQERFADAERLLARASGGERDARWAEALESARFFADLRKAQALAPRDPAGAEALLRPLTARPGRNRALALQLLGEVLLAQAKDVEAEAAYRAAAAADPAAAGVDLASARARVSHAKANRLWRSGDLAGADTSFETALAADPSDPWIRYDFARFLVGQGSPEAARGLMSAPGASNSAEAVFAASLFANDQGDPVEAARLMSRIPAGARTQQMRSLAEDLQVRSALAMARNARSAGRAFEAAGAVEAIASRPGLGVSAQAEVASALYDLGDAERAVAMAEKALTLPTEAAPGAYAGFVSVLAKAGRDAEAGALVRQLAARSAPTAENRRALAGLSATLAAQRSDRLRLAGDYAGAFDTLSAGFAVAPDDAGLLAALARLYQSGNLQAQAGRTFEALLQVRPGDPDALAGVAESALASGNLAKARAAVGQALASRGADPDLYLLSARISQAAGDRSGALRALSAARTLRQQQISRQTPAAGPVPYSTGAGPGAAGVLGPNPFARSSAPEAYDPAVLPTAPPEAWPRPAAVAATPAVFASAPPPVLTATATATAAASVGQDQVLAAIDQQIAQLAPAERPGMDARADYRGRSGEDGLSRLNELSAQASLSLPLFGAGRLSATMSPVALNAGTAAPASRRRFGTNAIPDALGVVAPRSGLAALDPGPQSAAGVAASLGLEVGGLKADVGTTPIGMGANRVVGGVSYEQRFGPTVSAKAFVERRPVTDSLASYAGAKDPVSGAIWGEVMRGSAGGNLSFDAPAYGAYVQGSASRYGGLNVPNNDGYEVNVGAYVRPYHTDDSRLQIGANLNHQHYAANQNFFSLGHGGYFSPQQFTSLSMPINYTVKRGRWRLELEGAPGYQTYTEDAAPYFPVNPELQGRLAALAVRNQTIQAVYPARTKDGFAASGRATVAYRIAPGAEAGGEARINTFGDYDEARFGLFLRVPFGAGSSR